MEYRCSSRIHAVVDESNGTISFRCHSKRCGHGGGTVVEHVFALKTGEFIETRKFRSPDGEASIVKEREASCR